jgi:hypothetical protein
MRQNYAGDLLLPSARVIIHTILSIFPTCRIYRESPAAVPKESSPEPEIDFTNMVIFCTNSASPITFRTPIEKDFLGSGARQMFLLPKHEMVPSGFGSRESVDEDGGLLYSNNTERFRVWQQEGALGHWGVMRNVLPAKIWEDW